MLSPSRLPSSPFKREMSIGRQQTKRRGGESQKFLQKLLEGDVGFGGFFFALSLSLSLYPKSREEVSLTPPPLPRFPFTLPHGVALGLVLGKREREEKVSGGF